MAALALKGWQEAGLCLDWYLIGGFGVPRCWIGGGIGAAWNKGTPPPLLQCFLSESVKLPVNLSPSGSTSSCVSEFVLVRALFCYMSEFFINLEWRRWMDDLRFQGAILVDALSRPGDTHLFRRKKLLLHCFTRDAEKMKLQRLEHEGSLHPGIVFLFFGVFVGSFSSFCSWRA